MSGMMIGFCLANQLVLEVTSSMLGQPGLHPAAVIDIKESHWSLWSCGMICGFLWLRRPARSAAQSRPVLPHRQDKKAHGPSCNLVGPQVASPYIGCDLPGMPGIALEGMGREGRGYEETRSAQVHTGTAWGELTDLAACRRSTLLSRTPSRIFSPATTPRASSGSSSPATWPQVLLPPSGSLAAIRQMSGFLLNQGALMRWHFEHGVACCSFWALPPCYRHERCNKVPSLSGLA